MLTNWSRGFALCVAWNPHSARGPAYLYATEERVRLPSRSTIQLGLKGAPHRPLQSAWMSTPQPSAGGCFIAILPVTERSR
jgi:hypothetical protein